MFYHNQLKFLNCYDIEELSENVDMYKYNNRKIGEIYLRDNYDSLECF